MKHFMPPTPVFINESVVLTSVGHDTETTAASMRAGLSRPVTISGFAEFTEDGEEDIQGFPISLLTHGFDGAGRYIQLMSNGFSKLLESESVAGDQAAGLYLLMCVPDLGRYMLHADIDEAPEDNPFQFYNSGWDETVNVALTQSGLGEKLTGVSIVTASPATSVRVLEQAVAIFKDKPNATVIVGFVDSLTDVAGLTWLQNTARLKSADNPVGLMPGEAVSFLCMSTSSRSGSVQLVSIGEAEEGNDLLAEDPPEGKSLGALLVKYAQGTSSTDENSSDGRFWCISNLSGEERFAMEWGKSLFHYQRQTKIEPNPQLWLPNASLGEVGICYLSIAIAWAQQAYRRGYAPSRNCAVTAFCYSNARSVTILKEAAGG